jgi:2-haloacid dehalogenase
MMSVIPEKMPAIVFDLGGVLMDWSPYYLYCDVLGLTRQQVDTFMEDVDFRGWNIQNDQGRSFAETTLELSKQFPQYQDLIHAYDKQYLLSLHGAFPEVVQILKDLKESGFPLYALSNWPAEKFALIRPQHEFFSWFDDMVISGEVGLVKPGKAIFELMLQRIGKPADQCIYIDDHEPNIQAASDLGFATILFDSADHLNSELKNLISKLVDNR